MVYFEIEPRRRLVARNVLPVREDAGRRPGEDIGVKHPVFYFSCQMMASPLRAHAEPSTHCGVP
jgi:hypothetical protein